MKHLLFNILSVIILALSAQACIEDAVSTSPAHQPTFSVDTLKMGETFTEALAPTHRFTVYNRSSKVISIGSITLRDDPRNVVRLNVDGISGREFSGVEIRPNDSILVFVEMLLPPNASDLPVELNAHLDFKTLGVTRTVVLNAITQDVERMRGVTIASSRSLSAARPIQVFDSLVVAPGATLTLEPGTRLLFHDKASLIVRGTLISCGEPGLPVSLTGDRTGFVASDIPYELMSGQWDGVYFTTTSRANLLRHTSVRNTEAGVVVDSIPTSPSGLPALTLEQSQLRNSKGFALTAYFADIEAYSSEITDAAAGVLCLVGGSHTFNHCTIANYYLFSAFGGPAIQMFHLDDDTALESPLPRLKARFDNTIVYGLGSQLSHGDLTGTDVLFRNCIIGVAGSDDDNFINTVWDTDPLYLTDRPAYIFDYRLSQKSPAIGAADPSLTLPKSLSDIDGLPRSSSTPSIGAHEGAATPADISKANGF